MTYAINFQDLFLLRGLGLARSSEGGEKMNPVALGNRMRQAREQAGLSQEVAATYLGLKGSALSQYETGKRGVDALVLDRLASLYGVPPAFFFEEGSLDQWEQALREKAAELSDEGKVGISSLVGLVRNLEDLYETTGVRLPPNKQSPFRAAPDTVADSDVLEYAQRAREHYKLGTAPIKNTKDFLELQGYHVFTVPLGKTVDDLSGMIFWHPKLGAIIALNENQAPVRRAFTMAHELAHGLFHHDRQAILCRHGAANPIEEFADGFASHFLITEQALNNQLRKMGVNKVSQREELAELVRYFGVSPKAMRRRLEVAGQLKGEVKVEGILNLAQALGLPVADYELGKKPLPLSERYPSAYLELVFKAQTDSKISRRRAAELLGMSEIEFDEMLEGAEKEESETYAIS